jgi:hypothetical protein
MHVAARRRLSPVAFIGEDAQVVRRSRKPKSGTHHRDDTENNGVFHGEKILSHPDQAGFLVSRSTV